MGRIISDAVRREVEKDIRSGVAVKDIAVNHSVSIAHVYRVRAFQRPLAIPKPLEVVEPSEEPTAILREPTCCGCYWGKLAGHKITCFWQKCRKGGRL